jgi:hypothetical protein
VADVPARDVAAHSGWMPKSLPHQWIAREERCETARCPQAAPRCGALCHAGRVRVSPASVSVSPRPVIPFGPRSPTGASCGDDRLEIPARHCACPRRPRSPAEGTFIF